MHTERGLDRLVTFLDAVVAIAITLLVLPLIDLLASRPAGQDLSGLLAANVAQLGAFALSFTVIAGRWLTHHQLLERVGTYDSAFMWLNLAWALTVVVLPFSTAVIADFRTQRLSVGIYIGTVALNACCASAMTLLVHHRPALRRAGAEDVGPLTALTTTGLVVLALVVGVAFRGVNFFALLLLLLSAPLERLLRRTLFRG